MESRPGGGGGRARDRPDRRVHSGDPGLKAVGTQALGNHGGQSHHPPETLKLHTAPQQRAGTHGPTRGGSTHLGRTRSRELQTAERAEARHGSGYRDYDSHKVLELSCLRLPESQAASLPETSAATGPVWPASPSSLPVPSITVPTASEMHCPVSSGLGCGRPVCPFSCCGGALEVAVFWLSEFVGLS